MNCIKIILLSLLSFAFGKANSAERFSLQDFIDNKLILAAQTGDIELAQESLRLDANINCKDAEDEATPLMWAAPDTEKKIL